MNKDCETCKYSKNKYNRDCVNIGKFKENDCLQYEMTIKAMDEEIKKLSESTFGLYDD